MTEQGPETLPPLQITLDPKTRETLGRFRGALAAVSAAGEPAHDEALQEMQRMAYFLALSVDSAAEAAERTEPPLPVF